MSYDLNLIGHPSRASTPRDLRTFLTAWHRGLYRIGESDAVYENADTGVQFALDLSVRTGLAVVRVPLGRPHSFGVEAAREIASLCRALELTIDDPQPEGIEGEHFSSPQFLRGYERANAWAAKTHATLPANLVGLDGLPLALPAPRAAIERAWQWNDAVRARQEHRGVTFVANLFHGLHDDRLITFAVWGDAMAILLPETDYVAVARQRLSSQPGRVQYFAVSWNELPGAGRVTNEDVVEAHAEYRYVEPPAELVQWLGGLTSPSAELPFRHVPFERLIDSEYLQA